MKTQRRCCPVPGPRARRLPAGAASDCAVLVFFSTCLLGILTWTRRFPFLVSALSIFLIANISMISLAPRHTASKRRQKNRSRNLSYCEPKSDAKLQPLFILTKYFEEKI